MDYINISLAFLSLMSLITFRIYEYYKFNPTQEDEDQQIKKMFHFEMGSTLMFVLAIFVFRTFHIHQTPNFLLCIGWIPQSAILISYYFVNQNFKAFTNKTLKNCWKKIGEIITKLYQSNCLSN